MFSLDEAEAKGTAAEYLVLIAVAAGRRHVHDHGDTAQHVGAVPI